MENTVNNATARAINTTRPAGLETSRNRDQTGLLRY